MTWSVLAAARATWQPWDSDQMPKAVRKVEAWSPKRAPLR